MEGGGTQGVNSVLEIKGLLTEQGRVNEQGRNQGLMKKLGRNQGVMSLAIRKLALVPAQCVFYTFTPHMCPYLLQALNLPPFPLTHSLSFTWLKKKRLFLPVSLLQISTDFRAITTTPAAKSL